MPFWRTTYHLVWATKNRVDLIRPDLELQLFQYLTNKAAESQVTVYAINGWLDHVHLVVTIPPKYSVATVVKRLKGSSSHYLNQTGLSPEAFAWQRGYGVFTLGESQRRRAEDYVRAQKEHHRQGTTNAWLERVHKFDNGPEDSGLTVASVAAVGTALREEPPGYQAANAFP